MKFLLAFLENNLRNFFIKNLIVNVFSCGGVHMSLVPLQFSTTNHLWWKRSNCSSHGTLRTR